MTNLTFHEKKEICHRIADQAFISTYRQLLKAKNPRMAGMTMPDKQELAESMVYALLASMGEDEITAACTHQEPVTEPHAVAEVLKEVKKKSQKENSTRKSTGPTWTTLKSGLRTVSSQIASTSSMILARLKKK